MKSYLKGLAAIVMICGLFSGCKHEEINYSTAKSTNTCAVIVGMENSRFAGACPGAGYDAERMYKLLSQYAANVVLFRDGNATKANVVNALKSAITKAKDGLVIFYYSGHGGSEPFPDTGIEETDGCDEFLCLYDTWMRDNEIWSIISQSKSRVFLIFDCCHSQTMMKNAGFKLNIPLAWDHTMNDKVSFSMLCWSGCPDNAYSYGSSTGGEFTNALLRHFDSRKTYEYLWDEIKKDKTLRSFENPQSTVLGNGFIAKPIFR